MKQGIHTKSTAKVGELDSFVPASGLDAQYAELLEVVFACERARRLDDRIDLAIRSRSGR